MFFVGMLAGVLVSVTLLAWWRQARDSGSRLGWFLFPRAMARRLIERAVLDREIKKVLEGR